MNHANFAETTLAAAITDTSGTAITVTSGASFPAAPFIISIGTECLEVTSKGAGTDWTVVRGYESSTAATHLNGATIYHDISAAEADSIAAKLPLAGGTLTGNLIMDNMDITLVKLLTLHGEIDDGNSGTADTIDWNSGAAHKSTLTGNVTLAFTGYGATVVPDMTSETAPSGVVTKSAQYDTTFAAWKVFDQNDVTSWAVLAALPQWVGYQFTEAKTITYYAVRGLHSGSNPMTGTEWTLEGSNNGTDWTTIDSRTGITTSVAGTLYYAVASPGSYAYYRWTITAGSGGANFQIAELLLIETGTSDPPAPCFLTLKLVQDATGGRTVTWPATVKGTPAIDLAANATSNVLFYWDGTNYWTLNGKQFVSATDKVLGRSTAGAGAIEEIACTAAGRALIDDAAASDQVTTLGFKSTSAEISKRVMAWKVIDDATVLTTGDGKVIFSVPPELTGMNLVAVFASVSTVSSSGLPTITIYNLTDSHDMLSTALTIDASEYSSNTAATAAVINTSYDDVVTGDRLEINVDGAGTGAKGLFVILTFMNP